MLQPAADDPANPPTSSEVFLVFAAPANRKRPAARKTDVIYTLISAGRFAATSRRRLGVWTFSVGLPLSETLSETLSSRAARRETLTHHKLKVYQKALAMAASAAGLSADWRRRHAIVDHFQRAAESVVLNIAEASRLHGGARKVQALDYAVLNVAEGNGRHVPLDQQRFLDLAAASAVKTAVYLDLFQQTNPPAEVETASGRELLMRMVAMLDRF